MASIRNARRSAVYGHHRHDDCVGRASSRKGCGGGLETAIRSASQCHVVLGWRSTPDCISRHYFSRTFVARRHHEFDDRSSLGIVFCRLNRIWWSNFARTNGLCWHRWICAVKIGDQLRNPLPDRSHSCGAWSHGVWCSGWSSGLEGTWYQFGDCDPRWWSDHC